MKTYSLQIRDIVDEADNVKSFYLDKPETFLFSPGQFCWIGHPDLPNQFSPMAIASGTKENFLLFTIRAWGEVTQRLFALHKGDRIIVSEPQGSALPLDRVGAQSILCIAGGTGITPVRSLFHSLSQGQVTILYGSKTYDQLLYKNQLPEWNAEIILEQDETGQHKIGLVTDLIDGKKHDLAFVVGPTPMLKAVNQKLLENGWQIDEIFLSVEKFVNDDVFGPIFPLRELIKLRDYLGQIIPT